MYTLIVADDEPKICNAIVTTIQTAMPEIEIIGVFHNGDQLHDFLSKYHADIVITDIKMPGKSGLDIARLIHGKEHRSYCLMITAHHDFSFVHSALQCKVDDFLTKPFSSTRLIEALKTATSSINERKKSHENAKINRQKLWQVMYNNNDFKALRGNYLCQGTALIEDLTCTQISIPMELLESIPGEHVSIWKQSVMNTMECDTPTVSIFYVGQEQNALVFLAFSPHQLSDSFFISKFGSHLPTMEVYTQHFTSIVDYQLFLLCHREMLSFWKDIPVKGINPSLTHLTDFLYRNTPQLRQAFVRYLTEYYQVSVQNSCVEKIVACVESLTKDTLQNKDSNINYLVENCKQYIQQNYGSCDLSLESTAKALFVSPSYLSRIFRKEQQQTFSEYLQSIRIDQAKKLLRSTSLPTTEVALAVGYSNTPYFRTLFKSVCGMTPLQYRQAQYK